ncbi:TPA: prohead core protein, partial [Acinetobacter baumannii]|nr:prohead core protein [Acinetobacter baumannii]
MATAKKNVKAKKETSSTDHLKKLTGLIDQLEEHIIRRHKFPYGSPSAYAEHYKAYLPEQVEPVSEEITENDRKWFYEQLDQGLLNESPEQYALRQQARRLPPPLLRGKSKTYIYIPEEDRLARHYSEIATEIRDFKNIVSTIKVRIFKEKEKQAEKHFKEAFRLYSEHYDCSFYVYTLPEDIYKQIRQSQLARNSHKQSYRIKEIYFSIVQRFITEDKETYSSMNMVLGAIEEQALSQIPEELVQEYNSEIEHCLLKKEEAEYYLFATQNDLSTVKIKYEDEDVKKIKWIEAQKRDQPLISFMGYPTERFEEMRTYYLKKSSKLTQLKNNMLALIPPTKDEKERMELLNPH